MTDFVPAAPGDAVTLADGILWARFPLPFRLDHVNVYFIREDTGWAAVDTGIDDAVTRQDWLRLLSGPLSGGGLTRVIATHFHPDHVGLAGWLSERLGIPLHMSRTEYLMCEGQLVDPGEEVLRSRYRRLVRLGLDAETIDHIIAGHARYRSMVTPPPSTFEPLSSATPLTLKEGTWAVTTGGGHSPEQVALYSQPRRIFISADQVLQRISPNIGTSYLDPDGDPLGEYLASLERIRQTIPDDVLVLPGHGEPFHGLHARIRELIDHHHLRLDLIVKRCRDGACDTIELLPLLFSRPLEIAQMGFAIAELLAHVDYLIHRGLIEDVGDRHARMRLVAV